MGPEGVRVRDSRKLTELEAYAVEAVTHQVSKGKTTVSIKMRDPNPAIARLGRHLGLAGYLSTPGGVRVNGQAGVLLDGGGGVTIYLPAKDPDPHAEPPPLSEGKGGPDHSVGRGVTGPM